MLEARGRARTGVAPPMDDPPARRRITRRRFLQGLGVASLAGLWGAAAIRFLTGTTRPVAGVVSGDTSPPSSGAPATSASPTPDLSGLREHFRSRPDLTPPSVIVNVPAGNDVAPGLVFFTPSDGDGTDGPMIADDAGELVWLRPDGGQRRATDLRVVEFGGSPALLWWEGTINGGIGTGDVVVVDGSYREIARIQVGNGYPVDLHECQLTTRGTALLTGDAGVAATRAAGAPGYKGQLLDCGVWEVDLATRQVVFEWHGVDHVGLDESFIAAPAPGTAIWDYLHVNSIAEDVDGSLLLSARNTSAVYKVDRRTGAVVWRLGGKRSDFAIGPGAAFSWQHDARRQADGTISIFDDSADPGTSRGIFLDLDETAMRATLARSYAREPAVLAHSQGSVQVLPNGNVFVGWGDTPYWTEFDRAGTVVFDATFPAAKQSYRVFRFPWVGRPTELPAIAAVDDLAGGATVYASWNGATEVASWEVLAGPSASGLASVARAARSGFETVIPLASRPAVVAVRALGSDGRSLGESATVTVGT
jgi:Arylsulfotransferase (ASST)